MSEKVLVVGGSGMLGHKLVQVLGEAGDFRVHATVRAPLAEAFRQPGATYHTGVDLGGGVGALRAVLEREAPDVVLNAVGAIKQKDLHSALEETFFLNASLPHLIALMNPNPDSRVVHFSTDCVFRGDQGGYTEADAPDVEDLYGRSKACGELDYGRHLTIRTSIIGFELSGHLSLLSWFLGQPRGSVLRGFRKAIYSGLPTCTLSGTVAHLLRDRPEVRGLYHVASEPIDKYSLLERVNRAFDLGHELVPDDEFLMDRSLDDSRFRSETGLARPDWDLLVEELLVDYESLPYREVYGSLAAART
jgi:dTDP-4-dehydrorhamnose reductase